MTQVKRYFTNPGSEYMPFQPYLELNNVYQNFYPSDQNSLNHIVWEVYQVDNFDSSKTMALPDMCADIMTFYTKNQAHSYLMTSSISAQKMSELEFFRDITSIFGVRIRTGMMGNLFKCEAKDVDNAKIKISDAFWGGKEVEEKMAFATNFLDRWNIISKYITDRIQHNYRTNEIVGYVINEIIKSQGNISIKQLEERMGYSGRYLRMLVNDYMGVSIKQMCEVAKFQWMCNFYHQNQGNISLSELALQSGYYDQSHMNQCCKKLTGELPRNIVNLYTK